MSRGLAWRLAGGAAAYAVLYVVLRLLDFEPHALPLLLLCVLGVVVRMLVGDALDAPAAAWQVDAERSVHPVGQDVVLAGHVRLLESHVASRDAEPALRRRLLALGRARLEERLGVPADGETSDERLGPEWARMRRDPDHHLSLDEIDRLLTRIEDL